MGVDFWICKACNRTFQDCGPHETCSEDEIGCGARYCSAECAKLRKPEIVDDLSWDEFEALSKDEQAKRRTTCADCRNELETHENLLMFLLASIGKTRGELVNEFRSAKEQRQ